MQPLLWRVETTMTLRQNTFYCQTNALRKASPGYHPHFVRGGPPPEITRLRDEVTVQAVASF